MVLNVKHLTCYGFWLKTGVPRMFVFLKPYVSIHYDEWHAGITHCFQPLVLCSGYLVPWIWDPSTVPTQSWPLLCFKTVGGSPRVEHHGAVGGTLAKFFVEGLPQYLNKGDTCVCIWSTKPPRPHHTPLVLLHVATVARIACCRGKIIKHDFQSGRPLSIKYVHSKGVTGRHWMWALPWSPWLHSR